MSRQSLTGHTLYVQTKSYWTYKICLDKVLLDIQNMSRLRLAGHTEDVQTKSYWTYRRCPDKVLLDIQNMSKKVKQNW